MNTRTAGVISLIAFLTALVAIVWILQVATESQRRVVRIDSEPRRAIPTSRAYTDESWKAEVLENTDAYQ